MADLFYDEFGIRYQDIDELIPEFEGMFEPKDTNKKRTRKSGKCRVIAECADLTNKITQTIYKPEYIHLSDDTLAKIRMRG